MSVFSAVPVRIADAHYYERHTDELENLIKRDEVKSDEIRNVFWILQQSDSADLDFVVK